MEKWDLYTKDRVKTNKTHIRGDRLPEGLFHLVVHVWLKNSEGQYLISRRSADRPTFPLMWETAGGSVLMGEDSLTGAVREVREELGIELSPKLGRLMFSTVRDWVDGARFGDILDVWEFPFEGQANLAAAEGEVCDTRWAGTGEIEKMLESGEMVGTLRYVLGPAQSGLEGKME